MTLVVDQLQVSRSGKSVLKGISFQVESGGVYALLGGNGAGKSTTLLSILGFLSWDQGLVAIKGLDVAKNLAEARRNIAYLPESASLYEHLNAFENLNYFLRLANRSVSRDQVEQALDRVALSSSDRNSVLRDYSKGMRQKVAIALAILRDTDILLLDEPTSGLDPLAIDELHHLIRELADHGKIVLMVTHDVYGACQVADRIGLLRDGELVGEFARSEDGECIDSSQVRSAFAGQGNHRVESLEQAANAVASNS